MKRRTKSLFFIAAVIILPVAGYLLSYLATLAVPPSQEGWGYHAIWTFFIILLLLIVPLAMIKFLAHAAHAINPREKIPELKDIPKDKDQWDRSM